MPDNLAPLNIFSPDLFRGATALVTGGGRGIGKQIALAFARFGANVVIAGRHIETLHSTASEIEIRGSSCLAIPTNIREISDVETLVERTLDRFGAIDILVNNAGGQFPARPSAISDRGWRSVIDLNLNGTWNVCSRVGPHMVERGRGAIINIVHIYALERGGPMFAHSGAARAGVVNLTKSLAYYWARHGVTINALAPGTIETRGMREEELTHANVEIDDAEKRARDDIPAHRFGTADEMAAVVLFLASPGGRYINGTTIVADGALSLSNWTSPWDPEVS
jgi:NAD(P)-dependent dehydrogenase (short-subunit alcohol dehydrogenase family)